MPRDSEKATKALELRVAGAPYERIADTVGYRSPAEARRAVDAALAAFTAQEDSALRKLELARLDAMFLGLWPKARTGQHLAVDRCLAIMRERAELLAGEPEEEKEDRLDALKARRETRRQGLADS